MSCLILKQAQYQTCMLTNRIKRENSKIENVFRVATNVIEMRRQRKKKTRVPTVLILSRSCGCLTDDN